MKKMLISAMMLASLALAACGSDPSYEREPPANCPPKAIEDGSCVPQ
jgi:hypothetical protein